MENELGFRKTLPKGKRTPDGAHTKPFTVSLPEYTIEMLKRLSYDNGKTISALTNAMIWWGYHAQIVKDFKLFNGEDHE
jgi:hypothetical protein